MMNVLETQTRDIFSAEELEDLSIVASVCSCNNPVRAFWFTPEEISKELSAEHVA